MLPIATELLGDIQPDHGLVLGRGDTRVLKRLIDPLLDRAGYAELRPAQSKVDRSVHQNRAAVHDGPTSKTGTNVGLSRIVVQCVGGIHENGSLAQGPDVNFLTRSEQIRTFDLQFG